MYPSKVICLDTGADKDEALERLAKKYKQEVIGLKTNLNLKAVSQMLSQGILMEHGHNMNKEVDGS